MLLAARLFDADLVVDAGAGTRVSRLRRWTAGIRPVPRGGPGVDLVIARSPQDLGRLLATPCLSAPSRARALWIIDSFRTEGRAWRRLLHAFDVVAFTRAADGETYRRLAGDRAFHLPWGADALDRGSDAAERDIDLLRVGRQPGDWTDDAAVAQACAAAGLTFHGRPPDPPEAHGAVDGPHRALMGWYARTRFVLAFCNLVAPAPYTHPTRAYLTGRWTDALACGASVLGVPPAGEAALVDWPGALVVTDGTGRQEGLARLDEARADWGPHVPRRNHLEALRCLDWRWRLDAIARRLDLRAPRLEADLARLRQRIAALED